MKLFFLLSCFCLTFLHATSLESRICPPASSIAPCNCSVNLSDQVMVDCIHIEDDQTLSVAIDGLEGYEVDFLAIKNSTLNFFTHDLFENVKVTGLDMEHTSIISLSDRDVAFVGLEESLEMLTITDCTLMSAWNWKHLKNLKNLFRIDIVGGDLDSIGDDITAIGHLPIEDLAFSKNEISWIHDTAFSTYENLKLLSLNNNQLTNLKRSILPRPANILHFIDLSDNKIKNFPNDFFEDMPNLMDLLLHNNKLVTLSEKVFLPIWKQLETISTKGNNIRCDCRVSWVLNFDPPENVRDRMVICEEPKRLTGMLLVGLKKDDLWC